MPEACQDDKQLKALPRQLKAAERQLRRLLDAARAHRRDVKQRRVSRARKRTHKFDSCGFQEDSDGDPDPVLLKQKGTVRRQLGRDPWEHPDGQGWKLVATYHLYPGLVDVNDPENDWRQSGIYRARFLAYNMHRQEVLLCGYTTGGGCPTCGYGGVESEEARMEILQNPMGAHWGKPFMASGPKFLDCAKRLVDPAMTLRRAMPEDVGYDSLATLYPIYILFHSRVHRRLSLSHRRKYADMALVAAWTPITWDWPRERGLVRLQAAWRGWHFRHRVLYSPHTELGRRYLLRAWQRECSDHS